MRRLLIIKTGSAVPSVIAGPGDFDQLITRGMGVRVGEADVVEVFRGQALPAPDSVAGAVVTGSSAMVSAPEEWSERTASWLRAAVEGSTPVLGICYGHQLLAHALGGEVGRNPRGREIGTVDVELTPAAAADRLLGGLGPRLRVQATHVESVLALPIGARLLAANATDPHQGFAFGQSAWGLQFHPEFGAEVIRCYVSERRSALEAEGLDPDMVLANAADSAHGQQILRRFAGIAAGPNPRPGGSV